MPVEGIDRRSGIWVRRRVASALVGMIRLYRQLVSPFLPPSCRFTPTCSEYAIQAIEKHGPFKGLAMALLRLLKCHPLHPGGYDPV